MLYEVTIEDPKVFTRPWKMSMPLYRRVEADAEMLEYECYAYMIEENWPTSDAIERRYEGAMVRRCVRWSRCEGATVTRA